MIPVVRASCTLLARLPLAFRAFVLDVLNPFDQVAGAGQIGGAAGSLDVIDLTPPIRYEDSGDGTSAIWLVVTRTAVS